MAARLRVVGVGAALAVALGATPAAAQVLLDLKDAPAQRDTPYVFTYTPTTTITRIVFAGYQQPSEEISRNSFFGLNGGQNLLAETWSYTPGSSPSRAGQGPGANGVNDLNFYGVTVGRYDGLAQDIGTTPGQSYTLSFLYTNGLTGDPTSGAPSGFRVSAVGVGGPGVPAPEVGMGLLSALAAGAALMMARMRKPGGAFSGG